MQSPKILCAAMSLALLAACDGNPFPAGTIVNPDDPNPPDNNQTVVVPDALKGNIQKVVYTPATGSSQASLQIQITGLDTTPLLATWTRNPNLDVPGYAAFSVQEDSLDRMFVGLAATSADGSVSGVVAGDGGQFDTHNVGTSYSRTGAFTPPPATGSGPATGQVSYAGNYVGISNQGMLNGSELIPPPPGTNPAVLPGQPIRVQGQAFLNANFADNTVAGAIYNRSEVDTGFGLGTVYLQQNTITANGTFQGTTSHQPPDEATSTPTGVYGGVFGGQNAAGVAGAVSLTSVYDAAGEQIEGALEHGIFVLNQCGLPGVPVAPGCSGTAP